MTRDVLVGASAGRVALPARPGSAAAFHPLHASACTWSAACRPRGRRWTHTRRDCCATSIDPVGQSAANALRHDHPSLRLDGRLRDVGLLEPVPEAGISCHVLPFKRTGSPRGSQEVSCRTNSDVQAHRGAEHGSSLLRYFSSSLSPVLRTRPGLAVLSARPSILSPPLICLDTVSQ